MAEIEDAGERMIPEVHKGTVIYGEHIARYQALLPLVKNKTVLDIACGTGYGSKALAARAKKVYAVDYSYESIAYAQKHYHGRNIAYLVGDAIDIPLADSSVDVVVSLETIEHIKNYRKFLRETKRILKPTGLFIVSTPSDQEYIEDNRWHLHWFNFKELYRLLKGLFSHVTFYYQGSWVFSGVLEKDKVEKTWRQSLDTIQAAQRPANKATYVVALCSDSKLPQLKNIGVIAEPWSPKAEHDKQQLLETLKTKAEKLQQTLDLTRSNLKHQIKLTRATAGELNKIKTSRSWKLLTRLRDLKRLFFR